MHLVLVLRAAGSNLGGWMDGWKKVAISRDGGGGRDILTQRATSDARLKPIRPRPRDRRIDVGVTSYQAGGGRHGV